MLFLGVHAALLLPGQHAPSRPTRAMVTMGDKDFIASQPRRALRFSQAGVCMTTTEAMERAMAVAGEMTAADESDGERSRQALRSQT